MRTRRPRTPAAIAGSTTATATRIAGPTRPPTTTAATAVTVARVALVSGLSRWWALGPGRPRKSGTPRPWVAWSVRRAPPPLALLGDRGVIGLEQVLALREARDRPARHRADDQVNDEERRDLVDRVADQALSKRGGADVGAGLAEGGHQEVGAGARDAAEDASRDGRADERGHDAGHHPDDHDVRGREVPADDEEREQSENGGDDQRQREPAEDDEDGVVRGRREVRRSQDRGVPKVGDVGQATDDGGGDDSADDELAGRRPTRGRSKPTPPATPAAAR